MSDERCKHGLTLKTCAFCCGLLASSSENPKFQIGNHSPFWVREGRNVMSEGFSMMDGKVGIKEED